MSTSRERSILRPTVREEVEEELSFHLEMRVRELVAGGMSEAAARAQALRTFGDLAGVQAECRRLGERRERGRRRSELVAELWQDLRFGVRHLRRAPTFAAIASRPRWPRRCERTSSSRPRRGRGRASHPRPPAGRRPWPSVMSNR